MNQPSNAQANADTASPQPPVEPPLASLVDAQRLEHMLAERRVLKWRDLTHAAIATKVEGLEKALIARVDRELDNRSFYRKLNVRPAQQALKDWFLEEVRIPLQVELRLEEQKFAALVKSVSGSSDLRLAFDAQRITPNFTALEKQGLKLSQRDTIVRDIRRLMGTLGGVSDLLCRQCTAVADQLNNENQKC